MMANNERQPKKRTTLKTIAEAVGVNLNTVSCVLNPRSSPVHVASKTRRAILEAARRLNYRRNIAASSMAGGMTKTIGILIPNLTHPFYGYIAEAFEQEALRLGYQCFVGSTQNDGLKNVHYVEGFLSHNVNGILMASAWENPDIKDALEMVFDMGTPVVFIDRVWDKHPAPLVSGNHFTGGRLIGQHLLNVGHRSMLFMAGDDILPFQSIRRRIDGLHAAIEEAGFPPSTMQEISGGPNLLMANLIMSDLASKALGLMTDRVLEVLDGPFSPSVVVCANDVIAHLLIQGLLRKGLRVPDDVAVTGYDDMTVRLMSHIGIVDETRLDRIPALTTVHTPLAEIGRRAARMLIGIVEGDNIAPQEEDLVDVTLIVRESSRLPKRLNNGRSIS